MKTCSLPLWITIALCAWLGGCGQKGPLFVPGEAPASQTDGTFGLDQAGSHPDDNRRGDSNAGNPASSPVPAANRKDDASPDDSQYPDRLTSPLGTP